MVEESLKNRKFLNFIYEQYKLNNFRMHLREIFGKILGLIYEKR